MSPSQPTDITTVERVPAWTAARDQMIHACALQEHIIANAPILPTGVEVKQRFTLAQGYKPADHEFDVRVYLHQNADAVRAFQEWLGGTIHEELRHSDEKDQLHVQLTGKMFGCSFEVWTLADVTVTAVAA